MELVYGAKVIDKNGKVLGRVSHIVSDIWSGEIRTLLVRRKAPSTDLFFSPEDVAEATQDQIRLHVTIEELAQR